MLEKISTHSEAHMEELTWQQVREDVIKVNPEFAAVVDKLSPGKDYTVFKATYPYGTEILQKGDLYLPNSEGELVPLRHYSITQHVKDSLGYNLDSNPATLILENSVELFLSLDDRTIPFYGLMMPGFLFGLWRILNLSASHQSAFIWDMTAGARSIFMLPKISEVLKHNKLKRVFKINADVPHTLTDHWQIFKEIANHSEFSGKWTAKMLFFPKKWFEHLDDDAWKDFNYFLFRIVWKGSEFWRNQFFLDLIFSIIQKKRHIKLSPYIADTVKYLFAIGLGALPGFAPAVDEIAGPIKDLQKVYIDVYSLKNYSPIIMRPSMFFIDDSNKSRPVYYSFQFPNALDFAPKSRDRTSVITDLYEAKSLLNKYLMEISSGQFHVEGTPLYRLVQNIRYDFFHNQVGSYHGIRESSEICNEDKSFLNSGKNKKFPATSAFVKGCIRISHK